MNLKLGFWQRTSLFFPLVSHSVHAVWKAYTVYMSVFNYYTVVQVLLNGWVGNYSMSTINKEVINLLSKYCIRVTVTVVSS